MAKASPHCGCVCVGEPPFAYPTRREIQPRNKVTNHFRSLSLYVRGFQVEILAELNFQLNLKIIIFTLEWREKFSLSSLYENPRGFNISFHLKAEKNFSDISHFYYSIHAVNNRALKILYLLVFFLAFHYLSSGV